MQEDDIPEPGPGAHEMAEAFDNVAETQRKRSKGVPGLRSEAKRFALLPMEKEAAANPAPGAYPPLIKLRKSSRNAVKPASAGAVGLDQSIRLSKSERTHGGGVLGTGVISTAANPGKHLPPMQSNHTSKPHLDPQGYV